MKLEQIVDEVLKVLPDRERYVLERRYGYRGEPVSQKDIGIEFGVSRARVGQIEEKALRELRYSDHIKDLEPFLYQAVSQGKNNFYARFFTKLFKLQQEHILHIIESGPSTVENAPKQPSKGITPSSSIECLNLSIRSFNCLIRAGVHTVGDLMKLSEKALSKIPHLGAKSLEEIQEKRANLNN